MAWTTDITTDDTWEIEVGQAIKSNGELLFVCSQRDENTLWVTDDESDIDEDEPEATRGWSIRRSAVEAVEDF